MITKTPFFWTFPRGPSQSARLPPLTLSFLVLTCIFFLGDQEFDLQSEDPKNNEYLLFLTDLPHQVNPIISGTRVVLQYDVFVFPRIEDSEVFQEVSKGNLLETIPNDIVPLIRWHSRDAEPGLSAHPSARPTPENCVHAWSDLKLSFQIFCSGLFLETDPRDDSDFGYSDVPPHPPLTANTVSRLFWFSRALCS